MGKARIGWRAPSRRAEVSWTRKSQAPRSQGRRI
jgi:hypothetical protein